MYFFLRGVLRFQFSSIVSLQKLKEGGGGRPPDQLLGLWLGFKRVGLRDSSLYLRPPKTLHEIHLEFFPRSYLFLWSRRTFFPSPSNYPDMNRFCILRNNSLQSNAINPPAPPPRPHSETIGAAMSSFWDRCQVRIFFLSPYLRFWFHDLCFEVRGANIIFFMIPDFQVSGFSPVPLLDQFTQRLTHKKFARFFSPKRKHFELIILSIKVPSDGNGRFPASSFPHGSPDSVSSIESIPPV